MMAQDELRASVLISTYNWPWALEKVFWGFFAQTRQDFELIIADDGSRPETAELVARMAARSPVPITHVWQPDEGFGKCRILNKALALARGERMVVTDGDCIVRADWIDTHIREARRGHFLAGSYFKQSRDTSEAIDEHSVTSQAVFTPRWLMAHGGKLSRMIKVMGRGRSGWLLDRLSTARPTWNGHSASCLRSEALQANGFNELMGYGGLDVEFGLRLNNMGLTVRRVRFSTVALHLHHERGYATPEMRADSAAVKERSRSERLIRSPLGVNQWLGSDGEPRLGPQDRVTRYGY
ncbi:glycosyltransferase [Thioclava indica]|uniref:Glycosyltransferase 2-like domain-containing protein n=1 Tax=Thioclava indica TaxID=1353528 RepID=A0A074JTC7_9RHOB|nr:glycosyltransferase [Thioclava indica]KEO58898.1 hypothetical protein DT23_15920 [Thioclava indica]